MVVLENDAFLTALNNLYIKTKGSGSVWITCKKFVDKKEERHAGADQPGPKAATQKKIDSEPKCLIRATDGKSKISTHVRQKDVVRFQMAYGNIVKVHMDNLKKREKSRKAGKSKKEN